MPRTKPPMKKQTPVLTIHFDGGRTEVYVLNPGEFFSGFGGSRQSLRVEKTASLFLRTIDNGGQRDVEYDINDKGVWEWLAGRINGNTAKVTVP